MEYTEIQIDLSTLKNSLKDIVITELADTGFESFWEDKGKLKAYIPKSNFNEDVVKALSQNYDNFTFQKNNIPQQNWNARWESNFEPITIEQYCLIRAPFHNSQKAFQHEIIIEPKMSFGTGHHQTTRLMIKLMQKHTPKNKKVLDMGCGTGILAIMALKTGASQVHGIDIDNWAVENTLENIYRNNEKPFPVMTGGAEKITENYDLILANINRNILVEDMHTYAKHLNRKGIILFSGFYKSDVPVISDAAEKNNLKYLSQIEEDQWVAMAFETQN